MSNLRKLYDNLRGKIDMVDNIRLSTDALFPIELNSLLSRIPDEVITIFVDKSGLSLTENILTIEGECPKTIWAKKGVVQSDITIETIKITLEEIQPKNRVSATITGRMLIGSQRDIPVILTYSPLKIGLPWEIKLTNNSSVSATDIISSAFNFPIPLELPSSINFLDKAFTVDRDNYYMLFYPNTKYESYTQFVLRATVDWEPIDGILRFNSVDICGNLKPSSFCVSLIGHMVVGGVGIDLSIGMCSTNLWLVGVSPTAPSKAFPGLIALAGWVGGSGLEKSINSGFSSVGINPKGFDLAISYINATVDLYKRSLQSLEIGSVLQIGAIVLDVNLSLPSITIKGSLHENKPLNVCDLLRSISLPVGAVPDNLEITSANFRAALKSHSYSISTEVNNVWQAGPFTFEELKLYLAYNSTKVEGSFAARFLFKTASETNIDIVIEAAYVIEEQGWIFSGGIPAGETLKLGDIIGLLARDFGIHSVPEAMKSLVLKSFQLIYSTATNRFTFECIGSFNIDDVEVEMSIDIVVSNSDKSDANTAKVEGSGEWNATFAGRISIADLNFNIKFDTKNWTRNLFIASYDNSTERKNIPLRDLVAGVSTTLSQFIPSGLVLDLKEVKFVYYSQDKKSQFLFGLEFNLAFDLCNLPVVGTALPEGMTLEIIDTQVVFASEVFTAQQTTIINELLPDSILPIPNQEQNRGLMICGELKVLNLQIKIDTGKKVSRDNTTINTINSVTSAGRFVAVPNVTSPAPASPSEITWFNVKRKLGPLSFERIGVAFEDNKLSFALDTSISLGPATLSMMGLSVGSSLSHFDPVFGLDGFSMGLKASGLELGGVFLRSVDGEIISYYGTVLVSAGSIGFKAIGGHAPSTEVIDTDGNIVTIPASFFIYANIDIPLGGSPFFSVNALAGGFGINNKLKLPTIDTLANYILLPGPNSKAPKQADSPRSTITTILPQMQEYFIPEQGEYWMAAGVGFSSFQIINGFVLVTVSFGVDLQVALLGSASITLPKGAPSPLAYIEIAIMASYSQSTGLLAVEGVVSPISYIFGSFCRLTGSFAFYIWIAPPHTTDGPQAGDFLVSMGGYHPKFTPPSYYPKLARLGVNFSLLPLQVTGEAYFAITPGMFMAGLRVKSTYSLLFVKAWFNLGVDFIIAWSPLKYDAMAYVNVGCSVNLGVFHLNVSIGATLTVWGPPFAGIATIDLEVVAFDIAFGNQQRLSLNALTWGEFKQQFLPIDNAPSNKDSNTNSSQTNIIKGTLSKGLHNTDVGDLDWIIDSDDFVIEVNTAIPANHLGIMSGRQSTKELPNNSSLYNNSPPVILAEMPYMVFKEVQSMYSSDTLWNPNINIKSMGKNNVTSSLCISLTVMNSRGEYLEYITNLTIRPIVGNSPGALWEKHSESGVQVNDPLFLRSTLNGFNISPIPRIPSVVNNVPLLQLLYTQNNCYWFKYEQWKEDDTYQVSCDGERTSNLNIHVDGIHKCDFNNSDYILSSMSDVWMTNQRNAILKNLTDIGFEVYKEADMNTFTTKTALTDWPEVFRLTDYLK